MSFVQWYLIMAIVVFCCYEIENVFASRMSSGLYQRFSFFAGSFVLILFGLTIYGGVRSVVTWNLTWILP